MRIRSRALIALLAGAITALSLPPFGLWWLAPVGYAAFAGTLIGQGRKTRLATGFAFFLAFFVIGLAWMVEFTGPGAVLLVLLEALLCTVAVAVLPRADLTTLLALPAVITLGEAFRYRFPLGGLPMASPALGQAKGPLLVLARVGGDFSLIFIAALFGVALYALWRGPRTFGAAALATAVLVTALCGLFVHAPRATGDLRVAYVQGGGPRGLRAVDNDFTDVFGNQVRANAGVKTPVDLVVWPEDVIDIADPIAEDPVRNEVGRLAQQLDTTIVAGVVEDFREDKFKNAAVAWDRSGKIVDRYDKVHRVPFGEYVPWRGLISKLADLSAVPRDAYPGTGAGLLQVRNVQLGVVISYEVFFSDRARAAIRAGGELLLVPTNASSFKGRQVPAQEVAAAQLRAVETGRDTIQAAPTGHSAFVTANGKTSHVSRLGPAAAAQTTLQRRTGQTPFNRWGDRPMVAIVLLTLVAAAALDRSVKPKG